jgi:hypothetical protein
MMHAIIQRRIIKGDQSQYNIVRLSGYRENIEQLDYNQVGLKYYWLTRKLISLHSVR